MKLRNRPTKICKRTAIGIGIQLLCMNKHDFKFPTKTPVAAPTIINLAAICDFKRCRSHIVVIYLVM